MTTSPYAATTEDVVRRYPGVEMIRELGRGAFSTVYAVRRLSDGQELALKVLSRKAFADFVARERFEREAEVLRRLNHPNIIRHHATNQVTGMLAFLVELVSGGAPLREVIRRGKVAPVRALTIAEGIAAGLEHAHGVGIVHRDIKPDNILLTRDGVPKIADFGIAKILRETMQGAALTGNAELVGTPAYMSPEQLASPPDVDGRADIYGLGVTLYEMLKGRRPAFIAPGGPLRLEPIDSRVDSIVARATARDPNLRYATALELGNDLAAARLGY